MAKGIRKYDPGESDLVSVKAALALECTEQSRSSLYTSTSFFIWLRCLKITRAVLWVFAVVCAGVAASTAIAEIEGFAALVAGLALLGVIIPGAIKALKLDDAIIDYEAGAAGFKKAEGELRRAANVWFHKSLEEFESDARSALASLDKAQEFTLTPPEWCFRAAQKKVQSGDYDPDEPVEPK